jgi:hypothetical protein
MTGRLSGLVTICVVASMLVPDGGLKWVLLAVGLAMAVSGLTKVPRAFWSRYRVLVALGVLSVVAIVASEILDLGTAIVAWSVGVSSAAYMTVAIVSGVRLIVSGRSRV